MREIIKAKSRNKRAQLALDIFIYRIKKYIGAYKVIMAEVDAVVFTGGIGENQPSLVKAICKGIFSAKTKILRIPTDEELMIARDTYSVVKVN
jgi:acetate kinase